MGFSKQQSTNIFCIFTEYNLFKTFEHFCLKETDMLSIRGTWWIPYEFNLCVDPHHEIKLFTLGEKCISKASLWKADPQTLSPCSYPLHVSECLAHKHFLLSLDFCSMCCLLWNLSVIICHLNKAQSLFIFKAYSYRGNLIGCITESDFSRKNAWTSGCLAALHVVLWLVVWEMLV